MKAGLSAETQAVGSIASGKARCNYTRLESVLQLLFRRLRFLRNELKTSGAWTSCQTRRSWREESRSGKNLQTSSDIVGKKVGSNESGMEREPHPPCGSVVTL